MAGVWWYHGNLAPAPYATDTRGLQITYCYLDDDPVVTAERLAEAVRGRWASGALEGLLAAPFHTLVPFDWSRHLPVHGPRQIPGHRGSVMSEPMVEQQKREIFGEAAE